MRSKSLGIDLDRSTTTDQIKNLSDGPRNLTVEPNGQVKFYAVGTGGDGDSVESFHLDTDEGFTRFVELITESAQRAKARAIKQALYLR